MKSRITILGDRRSTESRTSDQPHLRKEECGRKTCGRRIKLSWRRLETFRWKQYGRGRIVRKLLSQARSEDQRKLQQLSVVFKNAWPVKVAPENFKEHYSHLKDGHKGDSTEELPATQLL